MQEQLMGVEKKLASAESNLVVSTAEQLKLQVWMTFHQYNVDLPEGVRQVKVCFETVHCLCVCSEYKCTEWTVCFNSELHCT